MCGDFIFSNAIGRLSLSGSCYTVVVFSYETSFARRTLCRERWSGHRRPGEEQRADGHADGFKENVETEWDKKDKRTVKMRFQGHHRQLCYL